MCLTLVVQKIARHVARVDGFDQHLVSVRRSLLRGPSDIALIGFNECGIAYVGGLDTRHHVDARALQTICVGECLFKRTLEFILSTRQTSQATFTRIPIAGWGIEEHLLKSVCEELIFQSVSFKGIRKQIFDRFEAVCGGCFKTVNECVLVVEHAEVGSKLGHVILSE